jgi:hypothetical protein
VDLSRLSPQYQFVLTEVAEFFSVDGEYQNRKSNAHKGPVLGKVRGSKDVPGLSSLRWLTN